MLQPCMEASPEAWRAGLEMSIPNQFQVCITPQAETSFSFISQYMHIFIPIFKLIIYSSIQLYIAHILVPPNVETDLLHTFMNYILL